MNKEEKEVVNMIKTGLEVSVEEQIIEQIHISRKEAKALLNLIQKQSKVIDEMANIFLKTYRDWEVNRYIFQYHICSKLQNPKNEEKDCYADVWDEQSCRECIKEYFKKEVEKDVKD